MSSEGKRAALYARVSSDLQDVQNSIDGQLSSLRRYADDHSFNIVAVFKDEAVSGRKESRQGFQDLIAAATSKPKQFDVILVWDYFRFSRGDVDDSAHYRRLLKKAGVKLIAVTQPLSDGPDGRLMEGLYAGLAAYQSAKIGVDTKRGMIEVLSQGFHVGPVPFGYRGVKIQVGEVLRTKIEICPQTGPVVKRIFSLFLTGRTTREIAEILNNEGHRTARGQLWKKSSISWILKNPVYIGCLLWNHSGEASQQIHIEDNHPGLIGKEDFARVRELLSEHSPTHSHPRTVASRYLLSGMLACGCGHSFSGKKSDTQSYYICNGRAAGGGCRAGYIRKDHLEEFVLNRLAEVILEPSHVKELVSLVNEDIEAGPVDLIASIRAELDESRKRLENIFEAIELGTIEGKDIADRVRKLKARIAQLEIEYYQLHSQQPTQEPIDEQDVEVYIRYLSEVLSVADLPERRSIMRSFIKSVKVAVPDVTIEYTLPLPNNRKPGDENAVAFRYKPPTRNVPERLGEYKPPTSPPGDREINRRCPD